MRVKIIFTKNTEKVPNNLNVVNSFIHKKCFGNSNYYHDAYSDYNISRLEGGNLIENGKYFNYPNGGYLVVTSPKLDILQQIIMGVLKNTIGYGMKFKTLEYIQEQFYTGINYFKTTSSGFILRKPDDSYYTLDDDDFIEKLEKRIIKKFLKINPILDFNGFKIEIPSKTYKTKNIYSNNVKNISNVCQINITSNKDVAEHIYNYGIGQSTGSGFGVVYTTQNKYKYLNTK